MKNPLLQPKTMFAAVALTGLMAGSAARVHAASTSTGLTIEKGQMSLTEDGDKHDCKGKNACKGQGGCKGSDQGCKGKNSCKGKGGCKSS